MLDSSHGRGHPGSCNDVVIVGGGLAGLFCALRLAPRPVTVLSAAGLGEGASSAWAQGGIAAAMSTGDSVDRHLADTVAAGCGIVDEKIARLMVAETSSSSRSAMLTRSRVTEAVWITPFAVWNARS